MAPTRGSNNLPVEMAGPWDWRIHWLIRGGSDSCSYRPDLGNFRLQANHTITQVLELLSLLVHGQQQVVKTVECGSTRPGIPADRVLARRIM